MRIKSVLALSAFSLATLFAGIGYAADLPSSEATESSQTQQMKPSKKAKKAKAKKTARAHQAKRTAKAHQTKPTVYAQAADEAQPSDAAKNDAAKNNESTGNESTHNATDPSTPAAPATSSDTTQTTDSTVVAEEPKKVHHKHRRHHKHKHHRHHRHHRHHHHHHHRHHHHHYHPHFYPYPHYHAPRSNFLLGGEMGYASQKGNFISGYITNPSVFPQPGFRGYTQATSKVTDAGVLFGVLGGWQARCNRVMLGLEGNVDFHSFEKERPFVVTDINGNLLQGDVLYQRGTVYALTARAGYFVTSFFMPYIRLGAQVSRDELNYQAFIGPLIIGLNQQELPIVINGIPDYSHMKRTMWAPVAGIGAEFPTYIGSSTLRVEYNFTRDVKSLIIDDGVFPIVGSHKYRYPETHIGKVSWVWNFL